MKIVADENIPCVEQAFASLGEVSLVHGRKLQPAHVRDADILLVRSVTRVDETLLADSPVRFVGSATIGFDHVDLDYLSRCDIGFARAPGSNATSAAEYVVSAIMVLSEQLDFDPADKTVGIIGHGNVGSRVRARLEALGMRCMVNDPPLQAQGGQDDFVDLPDVLRADIITVHVPYTRDGRWPTHHLVNAGLLEQLRPNVIVLNTSRGAVADNPAMETWLAAHRSATAVLDVWEGEPSISLSLMDRVALATPHIAGYSLDGKLRGTDMIYRAACDFFGKTASWTAADAVPVSPALNISCDQGRLAAVRAAVLATYDIRTDDAALRAIKLLDKDAQAARFDQLRKEYPVRREFSEIKLVMETDDAELRRMLGALGFKLSAVPATA